MGLYSLQATSLRGGKLKYKTVSYLPQIDGELTSTSKVNRQGISPLFQAKVVHWGTDVEDDSLTVPWHVWWGTRLNRLTLPGTTFTPALRPDAYVCQVLGS